MSAQGARIDILFLIRAMGRGGAERQLSLLARTLHRRGVRVVVAVFYRGGPLAQELHDSGVELLDLKKPGRWSNFGVLIQLAAYVRRNKPRVLHSYMSTQNVLALLLRPWLKLQRCRVVCGIRTSLPNAWNYSKVAGIVDVLQSRLLPFADRVICNSQAALANLRTHIADGRGLVVPNGIEHERFNFNQGIRIDQREAWSATEDEVLLGLVGRLDPRKNHTLLVDALRLAGDQMRNVRLVFVGDGPTSQRAKIEAHANATSMSSRILWAGPSDDLAAVYSALDMFCLCSVVEGFPNVLAEAMCAGLPCVTTDVGDAAEVVGDCGWVVPSGDAQALANALIQAHDALPSWDRERPRRRVVENFSVDRLADRTLAALAPFLDEAAG
ncbi:glycosyltransferase [Pseudoxanthomonas koreensis]|uniref:glycosyltransferase n=1 Tax=Pseudoxanthomonas koreensis TaxID=266061 RepID=UPI0035A5952E